MNFKNFFVRWIFWTAALPVAVLLGIGFITSLYLLGIHFPIVIIISVLVGISSIMAYSTGKEQK